MYGNHCVKDNIANVKERLKNKFHQLNVKHQSTFTQGNLPEMYISPKLGCDNMSYYQENIGCLWWAIEVGRPDIATEFSLLSIYMDLPSHFHLEKLFKMFACLKKYLYSRRVVNPAYMIVEDNCGNFQPGSPVVGFLWWRKGRNSCLCTGITG